LLVLMNVRFPCKVDGMTFVLRKEDLQGRRRSRYRPNAHLKCSGVHGATGLSLMFVNLLCVS
jgi:hypothetical protein